MFSWRCSAAAACVTFYDVMLGGEDGRSLFVAAAPDFEPADRRARAEGRIETLRVQVPGPSV